MRTFALSLLLLLPFAFGAACTTEEGTTPECEQNAGPDGITRSEGGCNQFPGCSEPDLPNGGQASGCCKAIVDENLAKPEPIDCLAEGYVCCALVDCRLGYGVPASAFREDERTQCITETGTTTGTTTTTTTTSSTGGGGGSGGAGTGGGGGGS
jgi:hypothetical protein